MAHALAALPPGLEAQLDVVIPTIRDLSFLEDWRPVLARYHLIVVQDGDAGRDVAVPPGFDADVYTRADVLALLGPLASCISFRDSACRCFGFLVSKRRYVFTLDDDCFVAPAPPGAGGGPGTTPDGRVDAPAQHLLNLLTPATPEYFNTLYDPFRAGADFVRGYPFSLRAGVPTAVSHGGGRGGACSRDPRSRQSEAEAGCLT